jgi:hypothetical protein
MTREVCGCTREVCALGVDGNLCLFVGTNLKSLWVGGVPRPNLKKKKTTCSRPPLSKCAAEQPRSCEERHSGERRFQRGGSLVRQRTAPRDSGVMPFGGPATPASAATPADPATTYTATSTERFLCAACGAGPLAAKARKWCGKCHAAPYCGAACQRANWPSHKLMCAPAETGDTPKTINSSIKAGVVPVVQTRIQTRVESAWFRRFKLQYDKLLSRVAFKSIYLCPYIRALTAWFESVPGRALHSFP